LLNSVSGFVYGQEAVSGEGGNEATVPIKWGEFLGRRADN
jgi:hypothetical protein